MKLRKRIVLGIVGLAAAVVVLWALQPAPRPVDVTQVHRGDLVQRFEEEGRTRLPKRWVLAAPIAGTLRRIELLQGDTVTRGQALAAVEPAHGALLDPASRERLEAEAEAARANVQAAAQRLTAARADADLADREWQRMHALEKTGAVSKAVLDQAEARRSMTRATVSATEAEHRAALRQVAALQAVLHGQGRSGGTAVPVLSPIDGVVLRRFEQSAMPVQAGQPLLELGDLARLQVMVQALSQQALTLRPGTPAKILRWGGDRPLPARVVRIEPGGFTKISALGVEEQRTEVWLEITAPRAQWARLGDGYRVEVEFEVARKPDVLQVASSAVFRDGRQWAAYRVDGRRVHRVHVTLGLRGDGAVQVLSGLKAGDTVVAYPDDQMTDGARIRPLEPASGT